MYVASRSSGKPVGTAALFPSSEGQVRIQEERQVSQVGSRTTVDTDPTSICEDRDLGRECKSGQFPCISVFLGCFAPDEPLPHS
jgi:hypothetical protein